MKFKQTTVLFLSLRYTKIVFLRNTRPDEIEALRPYRGISLIRNSAHLGPYNRTMPRVPRLSWGRGVFLISEVPLCSERRDFSAAAAPHVSKSQRVCTKIVTVKFLCYIGSQLICTPLYRLYAATAYAPTTDLETGICVSR